MRRAVHGTLARARRDAGGATIVEFALVLPVLLLSIMGLSELCYGFYVQSVLEGAVQKAARDSSLQGGGDNTAAIDQVVISVVKTVAPSATFNADSGRRQNYDDYATIGPEPFTDQSYNSQPPDGICDHGEAYTDYNSNGQWDSNPAGAAGQGGASDNTKYTMTVTYPRLFPMASWLGWTANATASATTMLKNQPYATQTVSTRGSGTGTCP